LLEVMGKLQHLVRFLIAHLFDHMPQ